MSPLSNRKTQFSKRKMGFKFYLQVILPQALTLRRLANTFDPVSFYSKSGSTLPESLEASFLGLPHWLEWKFLFMHDHLLDYVYLKCLLVDKSILFFLV